MAATDRRGYVMDYALFQVSAVKAFGHCRDVKAMVSDMQQVLSSVPGMVRKNERLEKEKAELKAENAALNVELDDWRGNAEGFEPDAYMRLPLDADGVPIRIGDTVYVNDGSEFRVRGITVTSEGIAIGVNPLDGFCFCPFMKPERLSHRVAEPADSWERIAGDIESAKGWCDQNGDYGTGLVSISEPKLIKWADRIRKLAAKDGE